MGRAGSAFGLFLVLALGCAFSRAEPALAAKVAVAPVNIFLTHDQHSALLGITNTDSQTVRFSLSTFAWAQSDAGAMQLAPTADIIFFPTQLTLGPGEARNVRLGTQEQPGEVERSYRIFLDELPSPAVPGASKGMQVHVLSRIGIPIFISPDKPKTQADITGIEGRKGSITFHLENTGTVHILPGPVSVATTDAAGKTVFSTDVNVWYVLAGGTRTVKVTVPSGACSRVRTITVSAKVGSTVLTRTQQTPSGACAS